MSAPEPANVRRWWLANSVGAGAVWSAEGEGHVSIEVDLSFEYGEQRASNFRHLSGSDDSAAKHVASFREWADVIEAAAAFAAKKAKR